MAVGTLVGIAVPLITFILLAAVGLDLRPADFRRVLGCPRLVVAGLAVPPLVLPPLAMALTAWFEPPPAVASGLLLVAVCPVGGISNTFTYLARGTTALSFTLTALSCALAIVTIPVAGGLVGRLTPLAPVGGLPAGALLAQLLITVVAPVSLGVAVRYLRPEFADSHQATVRRLAFVLLGLLLALIVLSDVPEFLASLPVAVALAASFIATSFVVGWGVAHVLGAGTRDRAALSIEFATRNVAIANMLGLSQGHLGFATFATTYFLTELPVMSVAIVLLRWLRAAPGGAACRPASTD